MSDVDGSVGVGVTPEGLSMKKNRKSTKGWDGEKSVNGTREGSQSSLISGKSIFVFLTFGGEINTEPKPKPKLNTLLFGIFFLRNLTVQSS